MACIHPINLSFKQVQPVLKRLFRHGITETVSLTVPCGKCINCLIAKESQLTFLANKELLERYKKGQSACFVTMTYNDSNLPYSDKGYITLRKKDVQLWLKNLRRNYEYHEGKRKDYTNFKYILCGEYGDCFGRPHYHLVIFGMSASKVRYYTRKLWKYGLCDIGVLTAGGIRYVCKYLSKQHPSKEVKELRERYNVENPFLTHSIGLGKEWVVKHIQEISDNDYQFVLNGKKQFFPRWVMRFVSLRTGKDYRRICRYEFSKQNRINAKKAGYGSNVDSYLDDYAYIRYQNNLRALRAKGISCAEELAYKRKFVRPKHSHDRIDRLSDLALYGDVVPF